MLQTEVKSGTLDKKNRLLDRKNFQKLDQLLNGIFLNLKKAWILFLK